VKVDEALEPPAAPAAAPAAAADAALMPPPVNATEALERSRAAGWIRKLSKTTGRIYYLNRALKKSQWEKP